MLALTLTDGTSTATLHALSATFVPYGGWALGGGENEETTTESIHLLIQGANAAAIQTTVQAIMRLLQQAGRRNQSAIGAQVWLQRTLDNETQVRTEVVSGTLELPQLPDEWNRLRINATLTIERRNWWEPVAAVELQLSAPNQSAATGGRTIYNHWDGDTGHGYWVQVANTQVLGDLPAPVRLEITNNVGGARAYAALHVANNSLNDPANFVGRVEGESGSGSGSNAADATCSGGNKRNLTINTTGTVTWALNDAFVTDTSGAHMWLIARVLGLTGVVTVRPEIRTASGSVVWRANEPVRWITSTPHLAVICTVPIPPGGWDAPWDDLVLALAFNSAASVSLSIDYLAFLPADNYQFVPMLGESVANNETIIVDGWAGYAGVANGGVVRPIVSPRGKPLVLYPNTTQCMYILQHLTNNCNIADTFSVRAYYRPRRRYV